MQKRVFRDILMTTMELFFRRTGAALGMVRTVFRQLGNRYFGKNVRFEGSAKEICAQIVDKAWQGNFYKTSLVITTSSGCVILERSLNR